jgi:hypothetical protein
MQLMEAGRPDLIIGNETNPSGWCERRRPSGCAPSTLHRSGVDRAHQACRIGGDQAPTGAPSCTTRRGCAATTVRQLIVHTSLTKRSSGFAAVRTVPANRRTGEGRRVLLGLTNTAAMAEQAAIAWARRRSVPWGRPRSALRLSTASII